MIDAKPIATPESMEPDQETSPPANRQLSIEMIGSLIHLTTGTRSISRRKHVATVALSTTS